MYVFHKSIVAVLVSVAFSSSNYLLAAETSIKSNRLPLNPFVNNINNLEEIEAQNDYTHHIPNKLLRPTKPIDNVSEIDETPIGIEDNNVNLSTERFNSEIILDGSKDNIHLKEDRDDDAIVISPSISNVSITNLTILNEGLGDGINNTAELSNLKLDNVNIYTRRGSGLRTSKTISPDATVKFVVSGVGEGIRFEKENGEKAKDSLVLGENYLFHVNASKGKGIVFNSEGDLDSSARMKVQVGNGGPAMLIENANRVINRGILTTKSYAPLIHLVGDNIHFENYGDVLASNIDSYTIYGSLERDDMNLLGGKIIGEIYTREGDDKVVMKNTDFSGSITMEEGNNSVEIDGIDLSKTKHITAKGNAKNELMFKNTALNSGTFSEDNLEKGMNLGDSWTNINLENSSMKLVSDLKMNDSGSLNLDKDSTLLIDKNTEILGNSGAISVQNDGLISFSQTNNQSTALNIKGNYNANDGTISLTRVLNSDGKENPEKSDHLIISGDVNGKTRVKLNTILNDNTSNQTFDGIINSDQASSLIQVQGNVTNDAFVLHEKNSVLGAYVYELKSENSNLNPENSGEKAEENANPNWNFKIVNKMVCDEEDTNCSVNSQRAQVSAQMPAYISIPNAISQYNSTILNGFHQRLSDVDPQQKDSNGGEVFLRYIGQNGDYSSDKSFADYGYDYDLSSNAIQLGANLLTLTNGNNSLRGGIAWTHGKATVEPKAADGGSKTDINSDLIGLYLTYQNHRGAYVDGIVAYNSNKSKVNTDLLGQVNEIKGNGVIASVEAGVPFELNQTWSLEPQVQLTFDQTKLKDSVDSQNSLISFDDNSQVIGRASLQLSGSFGGETSNTQFIPYARIGYIGGLGGSGTKISVGDADVRNVLNTFESGKFGQALETLVGLSVDAGDKVSFNVSANNKTKLGSSGADGWQFNVGTKISF